MVYVAGLVVVIASSVVVATEDGSDDASVRRDDLEALRIVPRHGGPVTSLGMQDGV